MLRCVTRWWQRRHPQAAEGPFGDPGQTNWPYMRHHRQAMGRLEEALVASHQGHADQHQALLREALDLEVAAATDAPEGPTRAELHRSAASLALLCNRLDQARALAAIAMTGNHADIRSKVDALIRTIDEAQALKDAQNKVSAGAS